MEQNGGEDQFKYQGGVQPPVNTVPMQPPAALVASTTTPMPVAAPISEPTPVNNPIAEAQDQPEEQSTPEQSPLIQWNASEFIDHQKNAGWFVPLTFGIIVLAIGVYFITRDILSTVVIVLAGITFGVFARQKPRTLTYTLLPTTIKIGPKTYSYDDFKTFSIIQDGALFSVLLEPIKRFMPPLSIYFAPEDGERIFDTLAGHIPHQERQPDPVDRLMRRIRF